jgi:hypothetical protein
MTNTGIEITLQTIAQCAWRDRLDPTVYKKAKSLTDPHPTVPAKVRAIVDMIRLTNKVTGDHKITDNETFLLKPPLDADDAVQAAATLCLAAGIPCRIVGARYGQSWTCWLAYGYRDGVRWQWDITDVLRGVLIPVQRTNDEEVVVECDPSAPTTWHPVLRQMGERMHEPYNSILSEAGRDEYELPNDVKLLVRNETTYSVQRSVSLTAKDPEHTDNPPIDVQVSGSVGSYKLEPTAPRLHVASHLVTFGMSHKQWELVKRLGDQAWQEYEKRFPVAKE